MAKRKSLSLYQKHLAVMIFINMCPIFHWMRNNPRIRNYYYYICLTELDKAKNKDSEILTMLRRDLYASKNSFDSLYGLANFINSREYKALVKAAPDKKKKSAKMVNLPKPNADFVEKKA